MSLLLTALLVGSQNLPAQAPRHTDRLVALARLDLAERYFNPRVATRSSTWDSLFAENVVRVADAPSSPEYARLVSAMMSELHDDSTATSGVPQRALVYQGFPFPRYGVRWRSAATGEAYRVDLGENVYVSVRLSEPSADTTALPMVLSTPESPAWRAAYPSPGYRILGAARMWSAIRWFYPYRDLMGEDWDARFREALAAVESAHNALEYGQALATFASRIHDTHVTLGSAPLRAWMGFVPVAAKARLIERQLIITRIGDSSASRAGLRVGDIVMSVDGESVEQRITRIAPYIAASTPQALDYRLEARLLGGGDSTPARLVVRGATGGDRRLSVPRSTSYFPLLQDERTGNIIRLLPGNIGYVDFDRLPGEMVDSMFRALANTRAIIFDNRGYPRGTAQGVVERLNVHGDSTVDAKFTGLVLSSPDTARIRTIQYDQHMGSARPTYTGKTVMLIDERTISQSEHEGLAFEAANGTTFIGSPTAGADGAVRFLVLPGNISFAFTGDGVRHADGRQLQRVGLQPAVVVRPTIAGIRAGRDEVLEAAFRYLGGVGPIPEDTLEQIRAARPPP